MIDLGGLLSRFRSQDRVGCDFGTDTFKVVQLVKRGAGLQLGACGMTVIEWGDDEEAAVRRLQVFLREHRVNLAQTVINLTDPNLQIREMELAKMPERDLLMAIRWNFREGIDGPLENFQVAYTEVRKSADGQRRHLMAYGVSKAVVKRLQERAAKVGLKLLAIEPDISALMAAAEYNLDWVEGERVGLLDLGFGSGNLLIAADRVLHYARPLNNVGLDRLGQLVAPAATSAAERRDAIRRFMAGTESDEAVPGVDEFYRQILLEIERITAGFLGQAGLEVGQGIQRLYLSGGGALFPRLKGYLEKNSGVTTATFDPFRKIEGGDRVENGPLYSVAVGLAIPPPK